MKKILSVLLLGALIASCKKETKETPITADTIANTTEATTAATDTVAFDITKIPISTVDLGIFPYLTPPKGYSYNYHQEAEEKNIKDPDTEYFAVNGKLIPRNGKSYKINIEKERVDGKRFNAGEVEKYYDDTIKALGGVQVNSVTISKAEYDRIGETQLITRNYGYSINPNLLDRITTYVIRTAKTTVWIQFSLLDDESGNLSIIEETAK